MIVKPRYRFIFFSVGRDCVHTRPDQVRFLSASHEASPRLPFLTSYFLILTLASYLELLLLARVAIMASRSRFRLLSALRTPASTRRFATESRLDTDHVRLVEVGPRDGLQNEKKSISMDTKLELIRRLAKTGVTTIEAGSFVPAKWVPQVRILGTPRCLTTRTES